MSHSRGGSPSSLTALERRILAFFQEHPEAVETVRGITRWLGEEAEPVVVALQQLAERGWLTADETSAVTGYALTGDTHLLAQIGQALEAE